MPPEEEGPSVSVQVLVRWNSERPCASLSFSWEIHGIQPQDGLEAVNGGNEEDSCEAQKNNGESLVEGKRYMTFEVYDLVMCKKLQKNKQEGKKELPKKQVGEIKNSYEIF